ELTPSLIVLLFDLWCRGRDWLPARQLSIRHSSPSAMPLVRDTRPYWAYSLPTTASGRPCALFPPPRHVTRRFIGHPGALRATSYPCTTQRRAGLPSDNPEGRLLFLVQLLCPTRFQQFNAFGGAVNRTNDPIHRFRA